MNPLTNVRNLNKINERELASGAAGDDRRSWHAKYKDSAWVFAGGLPYELSEGDVICIFSQYGEIVNVNLIRDKKTGKSRGFCFVCYEDQRSTVLAVDNFNGTKVLGRTLRVDHVEQYRVPKDREDVDEETRRLWMDGCAPDVAFKTKGSEISDQTISAPKETLGEKRRAEDEKFKKSNRDEERSRRHGEPEIADRRRHADEKIDREERRSSHRKTEKRHRHRDEDDYSKRRRSEERTEKRRHKDEKREKRHEKKHRHK